MANVGLTGGIAGTKYGAVVVLVGGFVRPRPATGQLWPRPVGPLTSKG